MGYISASLPLQTLFKYRRQEADKPDLPGVEPPKTDSQHAVHAIHSIIGQIPAHRVRFRSLSEQNSRLRVNSY